MTARNEAQQTTVPGTLGDHQRRIQILEAVVPSQGSYLQALGRLWGGAQFQRLTSLNNYTGGNGSDYTAGNWQWQADATSPFNLIRLATDTDADWFPFPVGNLGPRGTGYAVAVWYYGNIDAPKLKLEWATGPIDEQGNTSGPNGSTTSVVGPADIAFWGATAFGWYDTAAPAADGWDTYKTGVSIGWQVVIERSPFFLDGVDGTPLTADASGFGGFGSCKAFNGGGGPDLWWWVRLLVDGKNASSSGFNAKIGQVEVYRLNGVDNSVS